jgi:hypothetical protein
VLSLLLAAGSFLFSAAAFSAFAFLAVFAGSFIVAASAFLSAAAAGFAAGHTSHFFAF